MKVQNMTGRIHLYEDAARPPAAGALGTASTSAALSLVLRGSSASSSDSPMVPCVIGEGYTQPERRSDGRTQGTDQPSSKLLSKEVEIKRIM